MEDLFNLNPDDFSGKSSSAARKTDDNIYNPGPDQGQNGIYKSVIRFIPWVGDPSKSKYKKYAAKLTNPLTNERIIVDCPSTNGGPSILWSLDLELKKLANEEPGVVEEIRKYFNRYYNYYSCVYIKKDPQFPANEGKIKIYSYGYTIDNLIQQEINPEAELVTTQKINPFSLTSGKDFVLVIKRKTKAWRDFSSSKFMSEVSPLIITHNGKEIPVSNDPKVMGFVSEYFKKNSPDISQYFYKEWTDHEYEKVAEFIKAIVPYKQIIDNLVSNLKDEKMKKYFTNSKPVSRTVAPAGEDLEFTPAPAQMKSSSVSVDLDMDFDSTPAPAPAPAKAAAKPADDLDDLFADL
jgi:hypothetical protein